MIPRLHKWTIHHDTSQLLTPGENKKYPKISRVVLKRKLPFSFFWFAQLTLGNSQNETKWNKPNLGSLFPPIPYLVANPFLMFVLASYSLPSIVVAIRKTWASWHLLGRLLLKHGCPCRLSSSCLGVGVSAGSWREGWSWWTYGFA